MNSEMAYSGHIIVARVKFSTNSLLKKFFLRHYGFPLLLNINISNIREKPTKKGFQKTTLHVLSCSLLTIMINAQQTL